MEPVHPFLLLWASSLQTAVDGEGHRERRTASPDPHPFTTDKCQTRYLILSPLRQLTCSSLTRANITMLPRRDPGLALLSAAVSEDQGQLTHTHDLGVSSPNCLRLFEGQGGGGHLVPPRPLHGRRVAGPTLPHSVLRVGSTMPLSPGPVLLCCPGKYRAHSPSAAAHEVGGQGRWEQGCVASLPSCHSMANEGVRSPILTPLGPSHRHPCHQSQLHSAS